MTPTERHARNLARLAEVEPVGYLPLTARLLVRGVIERHEPIPGRKGVWCDHCPAACSYGLAEWPCADYLAAENALGVGE